MLWRYGAFNAQMLRKLMVGVLIELGDDLRHTAVECVVRKQQVFLVHSGECHESIGAVKPLLVEQLVLRTVAVNDNSATAECGGYIIPCGDDVILPDDRVIIIAAGRKLYDLSDVIAK